MKMYGPTLSTEIVAAIFLRFEDLFRKAGKMDMFETLVYNYRLKENLPFQCLQHFASLLNDLIRQLTELSVTLEAGTHVSQSLHKTDYECGPDCEAVVNRFCLMESLLENNDLSDFSMDCADTDICETAEDATVDLIDETVATLSQSNALIPMQESNLVTCSKDDNQQAIYPNQDNILFPFSNMEKIASKDILSQDAHVCNTSPVGITPLKCNQDFSSDENVNTSQAKFRLQEIEQNLNGDQSDIVPVYTEETMNFENQSQLDSIISCDETFISVAKDILTMTQERLDRNKASSEKPSATGSEQSVKSCSRQQGSCNVKSVSLQQPKHPCQLCGKAFLTEKGLTSHEFLTHKKSPEAIAKQRREEELILKKIGVISNVTQIRTTKTGSVQDKSSSTTKTASVSQAKPRISYNPLKEGKAQLVSTNSDRETIISPELAQCHQCGKTFMTLKGLKSHVALSKTCYKDKLKTPTPVRSVQVMKKPEKIVNVVKTKEGTKLGVRRDGDRPKEDKAQRKDVHGKSSKPTITNPEHKKIIRSLFAECQPQTEKAFNSKSKDDLDKKKLEKNQALNERKATKIRKLETVVRIERADPLIVEKAMQIREKLQKRKAVFPKNENTQDVIHKKPNVSVETSTHKPEKSFVTRKGLRKREKTKIYKAFEEAENATKSKANKSYKLSKPEKAESENNISLGSTIELPSGDSVPWIVCEKCVFVFKAKKDFLQHKCSFQGEKHESQKPRQMSYIRDKEKLDTLHKFVCSICSEEFRSFQRICYHMKKCEIGPYFCEICPSTSSPFETMKLLNTHKRSEHKEQNSYICNECGHSFKYKNSLNKHKVQVHELNTSPDVFKCEFCEEEFSKKVVLTNHKIQAHGQERQFLCQICGIRFSSLASLSAHHAATHEGSKKFKCNYCDKSFPRMDKLLHHEATHTGDKPFCCDICGRRFVRKTRLDDHRKRHAAERRFRCSETGCLKLFASKPDLNNHMKRHAMEKEKKAAEKVKNANNDVATLEAMIHSAGESFEEQIKEKEFMKTDNSFINNSVTLLQDDQSTSELCNDLCFLNHSTEIPNHNLNDSDNSGYFMTLDAHNVVKDIPNSVITNVQDQQQLFQLGYSSSPSVYVSDPYAQSSCSSSHYVLGVNDGSCNNNLMDISELGSQMYAPQMDIQMSLDEDTKTLNNNLNELSHMIAQDNMCHPFSFDTSMC